MAIPRKDSALRGYAATFAAAAAAIGSQVDLLPADVADINQAQDGFDSASDDFAQAEAMTKAARETRDLKKKQLIDVLRAKTAKINADPNTTDSQREQFGIHVDKPTRTPSGVPTTLAMGEVSKFGPFQHTLKVTDSGTGKAKKPDGIVAAELYVKVMAAGEPAPTDPATFQFVALVTDGKHVQEFAAADACKMAYYALRWVSRKGERGGWSPIVAATIAAA
jgi:hypothetical protein